MRGVFCFLAAIAALLAAAAYEMRADAEDQAAGPAALAVLDFDYLDTSGEPADEAAIHRQRLAAFMSALRRDLAAGGRYRIVSIACGGAPCASGATPFEVQTAARPPGRSSS